MNDEPGLLYTRTWKSVEAVERYARRRYRKLDQRIVSFREIKIVSKLLDRYSIHSCSVLDVPAGYGRFTEILLERDMKVFSADLNLYAMMYLTDRYLDVTKTIVASIWNLPFQDNSFELVFDFRLLQHFKDRGQRLKAIQELARVARRWILFSIYTRNPLHTLTRKISGRKSGIWMEDKKGLQQEMEQLGLQLRECLKPIPLIHAQTICLLEKQPL